MKRRSFGLAVMGWVALSGPALGQTPTKAQPALPEVPLTIIAHDGQRHVFRVELATTPIEQETGLMFRKSVAPNGGMLFVWKVARDSQMWMKNTLVPLDMIFIGIDGTIKAIVENTVPESLAVIDSQVAVRATLELAGGTASRLDIRVGDKVECKALGNAP
ncbi:MAG: DUF192 domain-containing protein [Acidobacteriota bacterium]